MNLDLNNYSDVELKGLISQITEELSKREKIAQEIKSSNWYYHFVETLPIFDSQVHSIEELRKIWELFPEVDPEFRVKVCINFILNGSKI